MQHIIKDLQEEYKGDNQAIDMWEEIKKRAYEMLMQETRARKKRAAQPVNEEIARLETMLTHQQVSTGERRND